MYLCTFELFLSNSGHFNYINEYHIDLFLRSVMTDKFRYIDFKLLKEIIINDVHSKHVYLHLLFGCRLSRFDQGL